MNSDEGGKRDKTEYSSDSSDDSDFSKSSRLRCLLQDHTGLDRILLAYNFVFLPCISIIFWIVFLALR